MSEGRILVVDDQPAVRSYLRGILEEKGYVVSEAADGEAGLREFRSAAGGLSLVILDLDLGRGGPPGLEVLKRMKEIEAGVPVLILSGKATVPLAVEAIRLGAEDVLEKDTYIERTLDASVEKIRRLQQVVADNRRLTGENRNLRRRVDLYEEEFRRKYRLIGESPAFLGVLEEARRVATVPRPVLIRGERGTGKELLAALIHYASDRHDKPFVTINCAAFSGNLLESELFGHEKGAFTGADKRKVGRFELADEGTLFFDEIGNMPVEFQEKVLRVLEYQTFERVAGTETIKVNVRIVSATNAEIEALMEAGKFRRDLYDRLAFKEIRLPPLRERGGDARLLVDHFCERLCAEVPWVAGRSFAPEALALLERHSWPGNVRELKNVVERLLCAGDAPRIEAREVAFELKDARPHPRGFEEKVAELERSLIIDALRRAGGNQRNAAVELGLTYDQLRHLYRKYQLKDAAE